MEKFEQPRRGEIWWVRTPGRPDDPHQPRPALVVSADGRNDNRDHVSIVPIYHRGTLGPTHVRLPAGAGGIPDESVLFCEEITTIHKRFLDWERGPMGLRLAPDWLMRSVVIAVRRSIGDVVRPDQA